MNIKTNETLQSQAKRRPDGHTRSQEDQERSLLPSLVKRVKQNSFTLPYIIFFLCFLYLFTLLCSFCPCYSLKLYSCHPLSSGQGYGSRRPACFKYSFSPYSFQCLFYVNLSCVLFTAFINVTTIPFILFLLIFIVTHA